MSKRYSQVVILCEDTQQEVFVRRFLKKAMGLQERNLRVRKNPSGKGSGEQFVREHFPSELIALRQRQTKAKTALVVVIDADTSSIEKIEQKLQEQCIEKTVAYRKNDEPVALIIPKRNIETWIHFLEGKTINEDEAFAKLAKESDCHIAVEKLYKYCSIKTLPHNSPSSLQKACLEYQHIANHNFS